MPSQPVTIAIDGPSGSGKSSVSKAVARRLGLVYLDTGAMYRAVAWWCLHHGLDLTDQSAVAQAARALPLQVGTDPDAPTVHVDGRDIAAAIRTTEVSERVSAVATNLEVRSELRRRQREVIHEARSSGRGIVVEGRDITTVVAPDAEHRILLSASEEARLARRAREVHASDDAEALAATRDQVLRRDRDDATVSAFFEPAPGVVGIDTSSLTFEQSVEAVLDAVSGGAPAYPETTPPPPDGRPVMSTPTDPNPKFADYAHPERLVSTQWLAEHLDDPDVVVLESDEDVLLYDTGHIPGALKLDWHTDLNDPLSRDYVEGEQFARVMGARGIGRDTTVVLYGDRSNWWAAYALWVMTLFGHEDVRLLDGGRAKWVAEGRELTTEVPTVEPVDYPVVERNDATVRAFKDDVLEHLGKPMVDVRSPAEFSGELLHMPDYPQEGAMRGGHIPGAKSVPWARAANEDGTFKSRQELEAIYQQEQGLSPQDDVVAYCRIGERSSHTWFVLTHLLGFDKVRNYDGSWTEWGNTVRVPVER